MQRTPVLSRGTRNLLAKNYTGGAPANCCKHSIIVVLQIDPLIYVCFSWIYPGDVSVTRLVYAGSTRLQPFGSRAGHVNAFTQLPNVLSTEYWLRKSSTESKNGDLAVSQALSVGMNGVKHSVFPVSARSSRAYHPGLATKCNIRLFYRPPSALWRRLCKEMSDRQNH